jgi:N-acetylmuramoyl-L-alanine amidase
MEAQTLSRLFVGMFVAMFVMLIVVAGVGVYKWAKDPVYVPVPVTPTAKDSTADVAAH